MTKLCKTEDTLWLLQNNSSPLPVSLGVSLCVMWFAHSHEPDTNTWAGAHSALVKQTLLHTLTQDG